MTQILPSNVVTPPETRIPAVNGTATTEMAEFHVFAEIIHDAFLIVDAEIRAARAQMARGARELAEGMVRIAIALSKMRREKLYQNRFPTFRDYLKQCHDLTEATA